MKVPPKRKGNAKRRARGFAFEDPLNESPSEKEGKSNATSVDRKPSLCPQ